MQKLTVKSIQAALDDPFAWSDKTHKKILSKAIEQGYVRRLSATQYEWISPDKIEELKNVEASDKEEKIFNDSIETLFYFDFLEPKTAREIVMNNNSFIDDIDKAAIKACNSLHVCPNALIPSLLKKGEQVLYWFIVQKLFINQIFTELLNEKD